MAYAAPTVTSAGLVIPSYSDILAALISDFQNIYGANVYLGNDSADYQFLSILALKMSDTMQALQLAYNSRGPLTAIGSALDSIVKLNGIARKQPSFSTCQVVCFGVQGTVITNGIVGDANGKLWNLPASVTLGTGVAQANIHPAGGGNGYVVGDTVVPTQGGSAGGSFVVTSVGGGGVVTGLALVSSGTGYALASNLATTTSGAGTSLRLDIVALGSTVTATCQTIGAITALPGNISAIETPTAGWAGVINTVSAVVGQAVELDSQLRARQALSTTLPSITMLSGTIAAIASILGVTRYNIFENPTGGPDAFGTPAHSITCVVEGGTDANVAQAIYNNRGLGCFTNGHTPPESGSTTVVVTDPNNGGLTFAVGFYRPSYVPIYVTLNVHALAGYTTATTAAIVAAVTNYLNSLQIGELLTISGLYAAALSVTPNISLPLFSVRGMFAAKTAVPVTSTDIAINFYEVTQGISANVTVTLV